MSESLKVVVLAGGPDREREVSLKSGKTVADGLRQAGHDVLERDIHPDDLSALDEFVTWQGDVIFPALHGGWGEGGGLQAILDERKISYVGCRTDAARLCMDKFASKALLFDRQIPTLPFEVVKKGDQPTMVAPVVIKPVCEGSSIGMAICKDDDSIGPALEKLHQQFDELLLERFCEGKEITIGVLDDLDPPHRPFALPPIWIRPAGEFYDFKAKYESDDTQYIFGAEQLGLEPHELEGLGVLAVEIFEDLGCRHMARVDFILDDQHRAWVLEANTIPGFTSHSLLPMAAVEAGIALPELVDRLVWRAVGGLVNEAGLTDS